MKTQFVAAVAALPFLASVASALVIPHNAELMDALRAVPDASDAVPHVHGVVAVPMAEAAPIVSSQTAAMNLVDDFSYIVVFKDDADENLIANHHVIVDKLHSMQVSRLAKKEQQHPLFAAGESGEVEHGLKHAFAIGDALKGYSGRFLPQTIEHIRRHPAVAFVERDSRVFTSEFETEKNAPWGLARVSHRDPLKLSTYNKYLYDDEGGEGVTAFVVDTGTNVNHVDFEGRAKWGKTIPLNDQDIDGNGHGTHCSGTIAGKKYGIAKKATVVAVKVLGTNGSGSMSDVIKGVEFVAESHIKNKGEKGYKGTTANMSLGGGKSPSLDIAVNAAVRAGVHFAVAAGNDNADACNYSPAAAENAVTVGATAQSDDRAYFSNYGKCVDIFGPGVNIESTYNGGDHSVAVLSGTSMASPHICGLLTYFLSLQPSSDSEFAVAGAVTPAQLKKNLIDYGTPGILKDIDAESPNVLAFNGGGEDISAFWAGSESAKVEEAEEEGTFSILPIDAQIADELSNIAEEVESAFDSLRAGLGLDF